MLEFEDIPIASLGLGAQRIEYGRNPTWFTTILAENTYPSFVKILNTRKVMIELVCAQLGRSLGIPIPKPALVQVLPSTLPEASLDEAMFTFASIDAEYPSYGTFTRDKDFAKDALAKWKNLPACAAFDIWIGIEDRVPHNILFDGQNEFRLIDHEDAISENLHAHVRTKGELAQIAAEEKLELELHRLRNDMLKVIPPKENIDFQALKASIPYRYLSTTETEIDEILEFLRKRHRFMFDLVTNELGIKQTGIETQPLTVMPVDKNA